MIGEKPPDLLGQESRERPRLRLLLLPSLSLYLLCLSIQLLRIVDMPESSDKIALRRERLGRRRDTSR